MRHDCCEWSEAPFSYHVREDYHCHFIGAILGGVVSGGLGLLGSSISGNASQQAAQQQASAANQAAQIQQQEFQQTQTNLLPFLQAGQGNLGFLESILPTLTGQQPLNLTTANVGALPNYNMPLFTAQMYQASPGYAATLQGGVEALRNAGTTKTGPMSGNVLKALQGYGTGLANADFQQGYQNYATNYGNQFNANNNNWFGYLNALRAGNADTFNFLRSLSGQGLSAGAGIGDLGQSATSNIGNALIGAGNAQAAGTIGSANAQVGGLNSLATALSGGGGGGNNNLITALLQNITGGGGGGFPAPATADQFAQFGVTPGAAAGVGGFT